MRAAQVVRNGEPGEVVQVGDVDVPEPGPGEVRVAVAAASLNYGDIARCRGGVASVMAQPPFTLGMDVCGTVDAAGDGFEHLVRRRVVGVTNQSLGGIAEYAITSGNGTFDAPAGLDDAEAAAFTLPFHTSYLGLHERAGLSAGETLVVIGGASAVGTAAIQLGVAAGARVIAVAGGADKTAVCAELGAEATVDHHTDTDLFEVVMDLTGDRGADVMFDVVGGSGTEARWTCMANGGRYVPVGFNDDELSGMTGRPLRRVSMGNFSVVGVIFSYNQAPREMRRFGVNPFGPEVGPRVHAALCDLVAAGRIRPYIGRRITIDEVGATLDDHANRRTMGRSVVVL